MAISRKSGIISIGYIARDKRYATDLSQRALEISQTD